MPIWRHLISAFILTAIALNLLWWSLPLLLIVLLRTAVPSRAFKRWCHRLVDTIYHLGVRIDSFLIFRLLGVRCIIHGDRPMDPSRQFIVVSNHRSWFDIFVIHHVITDHGPILKFLIKQELVFVPILGWLCVTLGFPRLTRGKREGGRDKDFAAVARAATSLADAPGALMNFAEGTRFTAKKKALMGSDYRHLLNPRRGGLRIMLESMPAPILDVTLVYPIEGVTFWQCLGGTIDEVNVYLSWHRVEEVHDPVAWLQQRWQEKDELIENSALRQT